MRNLDRSTPLNLDVLSLERPHPSLLNYYSIICLPSLLVPPMFLVLWLAHYFRFRTMKYRFDHEGISMSWGILFRNETVLSYRRIQDIHLVSNLVERWLGLGRIQIQTASGSSTPEMTIEGFKEFESIRDYLYSKMRGASTVSESGDATPSLAPAKATSDAPYRSASESETGGSGDHGELHSVLREIAQEIRLLRASMTDPKDAKKID